MLRLWYLLHLEKISNKLKYYELQKPTPKCLRFLADWKRLMLQKGFSHSFWCLPWHMKFFFVPNSVCFSSKGKCFILLSKVATFFPKQLSYLRPIFVNLSTKKHLYCQQIVAFEKKDLKIKAERRRNHWRQKRVVFQKTFWTSPRKTGNVVGIVFFFCLVNEIERVSQPISVKWKQSSSSQKKH